MVNSDLLISKFKYLEFDKVGVNWLAESINREVMKGVPQGSVLRPLLFFFKYE